jgi:hypothetical protein
LLNICAGTGVLEDDGTQTNATLFLNPLSLWKLQGSNGPFVLDYGTIGTTSAGPEVARGFHVSLRYGLGSDLPI